MNRMAFFKKSASTFFALHLSPAFNSVSRALQDTPAMALVLYCLLARTKRSGLLLVKGNKNRINTLQILTCSHGSSLHKTEDIDTSLGRASLCPHKASCGKREKQRASLPVLQERLGPGKPSPLGATRGQQQSTSEQQHPKVDISILCCWTKGSHEGQKDRSGCALAL